MIAIDKTSQVPAYIQVYEAMKNDILHACYLREERLPSVRQLAEELFVSRNTIDKAYQQLLAEGYIRSVGRTGYYVEHDVYDVLELPQTDKPQKINLPQVHLTIRKNLDYDFCYGDLPDDLFPFQIWRKLINEALLSGQSINAYNDPLGNRGLREEIARYLQKERGLRCVPEQIVLQVGLRDGLERLLKLFDPSTDLIGIEDPGFSGARTAFLNNRFRLVSLDVSSSDSFIADVLHSDAKLIYTTPSHQFPTGSTMPYSIRIELLEWAYRNDAYVIEDDYDSEFRYNERPIPSMQSLDRNDRVIYTGTFSKVLSPGLRTGYWVYPPAVLEQYCEKLANYRCPVPWLTQEPLTQFFSEGYWERYVRKTVHHFKRKRKKLLACLNEYLGEKVRVEGDNAGLHLWLKIEDPRNNKELEAIAAERGVGVYSTDYLWMDQSKVDSSTMLMGYSHIPYDKIEPGIKRLREAWLA